MCFTTRRLAVHGGVDKSLSKRVHSTTEGMPCRATECLPSYRRYMIWRRALEALGVSPVVAAELFRSLLDSGASACPRLGAD